MLTQPRLGAAAFPPRPRWASLRAASAATDGLLQDRHRVLEDSIRRHATNEVDTGSQLLTCLAPAVDHQLVATRRHVGRGLNRPDQTALQIEHIYLHAARLRRRE